MIRAEVVVMRPLRAVLSDLDPGRAALWDSWGRGRAESAHGHGREGDTGAATPRTVSDGRGRCEISDIKVGLFACRSGVWT